MPTDVQVKIEGDLVTVKGPKGELKRKIIPQIAVKLENGEIMVSIINPKNKRENALWGLYWNLVRNMVIGVKDGFEKKLEINGVGYKVAGGGKKLTFQVGFSHPVEYILPEGIDSKVEETESLLRALIKNYSEKSPAKSGASKNPSRIRVRELNMLMK